MSKNLKHTNWLEARLLRLTKWADSSRHYKSLAYRNALIQYCNNIRRAPN